MNLGLEGKGVLVTGGSGGIGQAIVRAFAAEGARVHFTYNSNAEAAKHLAETLALPDPVRMDLGDEDSIHSAFAAAKQDGSIDVLINNAVQWRPSEDAFAKANYFKTNIAGPMTLTKLAAQDMAARSWGRVVNISSNIAEDGMAGSALYSTAKAALHGMTASLQWDFGSKGVLINTVLPGLTLTERTKSFLPDEVREGERTKTPSGELSSPQSVANLVVFLSSEANSNIMGERIRVTGGR